MACDQERASATDIFLSGTLLITTTVPQEVCAVDLKIRQLTLFEILVSRVAVHFAKRRSGEESRMCFRHAIWDFITERQGAFRGLRMKERLHPQ